MMRLLHRTRPTGRVAAVVAAVLLGPPPAAAQTADRPVTLREAVLLARAQSPARRASVARVDAADLSRTYAGRLLNPSTELRWENLAPGLPATLPLDIFATVTQPIELGGERAARRGIAAATLDGARASLWATERALDHEIVRRYLAVVRERDRGRTLAEQAEGLAELVRILQRRVAEGVTAEADLRKMETERARVDTDAALARIAAGRELAVLAAVVGWPASPPLDALERPLAVLPAAGDSDAVVAAALERRPDVQIAAARLEALRQNLRFEQARRIPDLNLTGGYKRTAGYDTGVVALVMPIPLFEHNRASIVLANGNVIAAELELDQARRLAAGDARASLAAAAELLRRSADAEARLVDPAGQVRQAARAAFASGAGDLLRLVDAERVYADARIAVADLSIEAVLATIEARLALAEDAIP